MPRLSDTEDAMLSRSDSPDDHIDDLPPHIPPTTKEIEPVDELLHQTMVDALKMDKATKQAAKQAANQDAKQTKGGLKQKVEQVVELDESVNGDAEEKEDEYEVESIVDHLFQKKKCLYKVRWKGWSEADDTWEPEDHLLPESASILAAYHKKIGGAPQPPKQVRKTPSKPNLGEESPADDETETQPSKRQKRAHRSTSNVDPASKEWKSEPLSTWQPADKGSWEDLVHEVETVERDDNGNLHAFIRFRNGKRSKVANNLYTSRCPRAMLRFYEGHLSV